MRFTPRIKLLIVVFTVIVLMNSCVMDYVPWYYSVKNCTKDTLIVELTRSDTLTGNMYIDNKSLENNYFSPHDTISFFIHGQKVVLSTCYCPSPDAISCGQDDRFLHGVAYIYAIKWEVAKHYTLSEIREKKQYDRRTVTKKDFQNHIYEYRTNEKSGNQ